MKPTVNGAGPYPGTGKSAIRGIAGMVMGVGVAVGLSFCASTGKLNPQRISNATASADFVILSESC
jgi:hypothetical protein